MRALLAALALAFILIPFTASALTFTDTDSGDFNMGSYSQTMTDGENVTLENVTATTYHSGGTFTRTRAADEGARWGGMSWASTAASNQNVTLNIRFSNDSSAWTGWSQYESTPATFDVRARYAQYKAELSTEDGSSTPYLEAVTLTYEGGPPAVSATEPPDGHSTSSDSASFRCSANSLNGMKNVTFYWNQSGEWEANGTQGVSGTNVYSTFSRSGLVNGTQVIWGCLGEDIIGQKGLSGNRTLKVSMVEAEEDAPSLSYDISPGAVRLGGAVEITANASDPSGVDSVWAVVTLPGQQGTQTLRLQNGQPTNYTTLVPGQHSLVFYANDTMGNLASGSSSFSVEELITVNSTVYGYDGTGLPSSLVVYVPGTYYLNNPSVIDSWTSSDGNFLGKTLVSGTYDLKFSSPDAGMSVVVKGVDMEDEREGSMGMDMLPDPLEGYKRTYGVENSYGITGAAITMGYSQADFESEDSLGVYMCSAWDFGNRSCQGTWSKVSSSTDQLANTVEASVSILSSAGFSIRQEAYCGDGVCGEGESASSCPADCECTTGITRACGASDIPPCQMGIQTCVNGVWGPCMGEVAPGEEVCNGMDDDCDGVIDNVNNGSSVATSACQCYGGGNPVNETCNGIDDDCDGSIDENIERQCGSNVGACRFGISRCIDGRWGDCYGGIEPTEELCGDGLDNDCDGTIDEGCASCLNGIQDGDEEGIDCGGSCPNPCFEFPWAAVLLAVVVIGGVMAALFLYLNRKPPTWDELEEKYGAARAIPTIDELEEEFGDQP